jgi:hypothetical protein
MNDPGSRLKINFIPSGSHLECEIHILVVSREVELVEATQIKKQLTTNKHSRRRTVVNFLYSVIQGRLIALLPATSLCTPVAGDYGSGLLESAIWKHKPGAY